MAARNPAVRYKTARRSAPPLAHLLFQVGGQGYLLSRRFQRPQWAKLIDSHAANALPILRQAARDDILFEGKLRAKFGHEIVPVAARGKAGDPLAHVALLIERRQLYLFRLGQAAPPPPKHVADLRIDVPPVRPVPPNPNAAPAPPDLPSRMLIVIEGMGDLTAAEIGAEAVEMLATMLAGGAALRLAAMLAAWIAANFTPIGWLIDVGMISYGVWTMGVGFIDTLKGLLEIARTIHSARTRGELKALSAPLARLLLEAGLTAMLAFFLKGMNKRRGKSGSSGEGDGGGSSPPPQQPKPAPVPGQSPNANTSKSSTGALAQDGNTELKRPYIRQGVREEVEARAPRTADGRPIDPNTGQPIDGTPDFGHKSGNEFWREKQKAEAQGLTQKQFNDRMNNPDLYQLEDPSSNRSHRYERPR